MPTIALLHSRGGVIAILDIILAIIMNIIMDIIMNIILDIIMDILMDILDIAGVEKHAETEEGALGDSRGPLEHSLVVEGEQRGHTFLHAQQLLQRLQRLLPLLPLLHRRPHERMTQSVHTRVKLPLGEIREHRRRGETHRLQQSRPQQQRVREVSQIPAGAQRRRREVRQLSEEGGKRGEFHHLPQLHVHLELRPPARHQRVKRLALQMLSRQQPAQCRVECRVKRRRRLPRGKPATAAPPPAPAASPPPASPETPLRSASCT